MVHLLTVFRNITQQGEDQPSHSVHVLVILQHDAEFIGQLFNADLSINFHCLAAGTVLFAAFLLIRGGPANEISPAGLLKLCGAGSALTLGYAAFFAGLEIIGPLKASMLMNMEPVFTIIFAAVLLGERLSPLQIVGAGLVITGIILTTGRIPRVSR